MLSTASNSYSLHIKQPTHAPVGPGGTHAPLAGGRVFVLFVQPGLAWKPPQSVNQMQEVTSRFLQAFVLRLLTGAYLYDSLLRPPQDRPQFRHESPRSAPPPAGSAPVPARAAPASASFRAESAPAAPEPSPEQPAAAHYAPVYRKGEALKALGLEETGVTYTREDVKKAFNKKIMEHHPDRLRQANPDITATELEQHAEKSALATEAWRSLQDEYPQPK